MGTHTRCGVGAFDGRRGLVEPRRCRAAEAVAVLLNLWESNLLRETHDGDHSVDLSFIVAVRLICVCLRDPGLAFKSISRGRVGIAASVGSVPTASYF
jgi:hypothetical protein